MDSITIPKDRWEDFAQIFNNFEHALKSELITMFQETGTVYDSDWMIAEGSESYVVKGISDMSKICVPVCMKVINTTNSVMVKDYEWSMQLSQQIDAQFAKQRGELNESEGNV